MLIIFICLTDVFRYVGMRVKGEGEGFFWGFLRKLQIFFLGVLGVLRL